MTKNMLERLKDLRARTGCGVADCKTALEESKDDLELAVDILRKKGIAKAAKRQDRATAHGLVKVAVNQTQTTGWMLSVCAETDFVVRNNGFQELAEKILETFKQSQATDLVGLLATVMPDGQTVQANLDNLSGVLGEKLALPDCAVLKSSGTVAAYLHGIGRIGVLVAVSQPEQTNLAKTVAMQIAAANPLYLKPEEIPVAELAKEKAVYHEQLLAEGKPEAMLEKIMTGKLQKYYQEVCLLNQEYIKDDTKRMAEVLGNIQVEKFIRFAL